MQTNGRGGRRTGSMLGHWISATGWAGEGYWEFEDGYSPTRWEFSQPQIAYIIDPTRFLEELDIGEYASQLQDRIALGKWGEARAIDFLVGKGYVVIGQQVYVRTSLGLRVTDILAVDKVGKLVGFEVKTGLHARYTRQQIMKDKYIENQGGKLVSSTPLGNGMGYGSTISYPTLFVCILDMPSVCKY